ncbi:rCG46540 [Rattus norvegicus]|uniref:RCG46540 n=1 Tax=Rattus norvegicus TaxID=10116 RepID=A6IDF0_RAT|nr:rCG46540 [Rattus norvegicus]
MVGQGSLAALVRSGESCGIPSSRQTGKNHMVCGGKWRRKREQTRPRSGRAAEEEMRNGCSNRRSKEQGEKHSRRLMTLC